MPNREAFETLSHHPQRPAFTLLRHGHPALDEPHVLVDTALLPFPRFLSAHIASNVISPSMQQGRKTTAGTDNSLTAIWLLRPHTD